MDGINWTQVMVAYAAPVLSFLGLVFQCVFANRHKKEGDERSAKTNSNLQSATDKLENAVEENTNLAKENQKLIKSNIDAIAEIKDRLATNDVATVSVVRNNLRDIYYKIRPYGMISDTDYRAVTELYNAYKSVTLPDGHHPNSWCDALYQEMQTWKRVETYPNGMHHISTAPMELPKKKVVPKRAKVITK